MSFDRPLRANDRFDDLDLRSAGTRLRRQIKFSSSEDPVLDVASFTTTARKLRIDDLIASAVQDDCFEGATYAVTTPFALADDLRPFISPVRMGDDLLDESAWRLRHEDIWPSDAAPVWTPLKHVSREQFEAFSARFLIEIAPSATLDLDGPGDLEIALFRVLAEEIGVGTYPNHDRNVKDVAANLIDFANTVRVNGATTTADDALRRLALRTDYGRVAQRFPVVREALVERTNLLQRFAELARAEPIVRVIGPPGAGKSWLITAGSDLLREQGSIVARHYCYLEPGDEHVQQRITTQTLFGNLIAELVEAEPELSDAARPLLGSGPRQLEQVLRAAADRDGTRPIVLCIDGLDHIARVLASSSSVASEDTTIVSELATLSLPTNVHIVVASQPGPHLLPIVDISKELVLPSWSDGEVILLTQRLGLPDALRREGLSAEGIVDEATSVIVAKAEGNPLYATFICRTALQRLRDDGTLPAVALQDLPSLGGDVATYYSWLLPDAADIHRLVAEMLAFVEFGVTPADLAAILPIGSGYIDEALRRLQPVLRRVTMQGGIRLYHESFRRYLVETAVGGPGAPHRVLAPVVTWLDGAGFYTDSRAFRFLLPLLARSGRFDDVLSRVTPSFVEESIAAAHSPAAMQANLLLAANAALDKADWASFIRIVELDRSRATFEHRMSPSLVRAYAEAFVMRDGPDRLADRLLFDGRPTMGRDVGLLCCALIDEHGATPPWREYLALDQHGDGRDDVAVSEAAFRGWIRRDPEDATDAILRWLKEASDSDGHLPHALSLIRNAVEVTGAAPLLAHSDLTGRARAVLHLGIALASEDQTSGDAATLLAGINAADIPRALLDEFAEATGNFEEAWAVAADIRDTHAVLPDEHRFQTHATDEWIAAVRIAARAAPDQLDVVRSAIPVDGWAYAWLRFVLDLAAAERQAPDARGEAVVRAIEALRACTEHPNPFSIYGAEKAISASFARALRVAGPQHFADVLALVDRVSRETHSHFQGSAMGPLVAEEFLRIVAPYVGVDACRDAALAAMQKRAADAMQYGEFYETHAEHHLLLSAVFASSGCADEADTQWRQAATYLAAYGFRRDVTLFEPLEALKTLAPLDPATARDRVAMLQPLAENVDDHTDGKDTKWVYHRWFDALLAADPHAAVEIVTEAIDPDAGAMTWRVEDAYDEIAEASSRLDIDPVIAAYLQLATRGKAGSDAIGARTATLRRLGNAHHDERHLVTVLTSAIAAEGGTVSADSAAEVEELSREFGLAVPPLRAASREASSASPRRGPHEILPNTPRDLAISFHRRPFGFRDDPSRAEEYADTLGFRLLALDDVGATRLLRAFARAAHYSGGETVLELLGDGFAWRDRGALAAAAYAFAFVYARPEWTIFGRRDACHLFTQAVEIDSAIAHEVLRAEAKHLFAEYGGNYGFTQHTIELFAVLGDAAAAFRILDASLDVVAKRLPLATSGYHAFPRYAPATRTYPSIGEAVAALLLARTRHPEIHRRRAALTGVVAALKYRVEDLTRPLAAALAPTSPTLVRMTLLDILDLLGNDAAWCVDALREALRACTREPLFGIHELARALLGATGESVPAPARAPAPPPPSLAENDIAKLLNADARARTIGRYVPAFGPLFAGALDAALKDTARKEQIRARSERFYDRANERFADHFIYDHQAIAEDALHGIAHVTIESETEEASAALDVVRPQMEHYVAHWHSRAPRPSSLAFPRDRATGVAAPGPIEDPVYNGWYRIGSHERELLRGEHGRKIVGDVIVMSGVQLHPGGSVKRNALFVNGARRQSGFPLLLVGMHETDGPLGRLHVLLPTLELIERFKLNAGSWTGPIVAHDVLGPAIIYRQWRTDPLGSDMVEETPTLAGCELLLRSDLFRAVYNMSAGWVSEVTFAERSEAPRTDVGGAA